MQTCRNWQTLTVCYSWLLHEKSTHRNKFAFQVIYYLWNTLSWNTIWFLPLLKMFMRAPLRMITMSKMMTRRWSKIKRRKAVEVRPSSYLHSSVYHNDVSLRELLFWESWLIRIEIRISNSKTQIVHQYLTSNSDRERKFVNIYL